MRAIVSDELASLMRLLICFIKALHRQLVHRRNVPEHPRKQLDRMARAAARQPNHLLVSIKKLTTVWYASLLTFHRAFRIPLFFVLYVPCAQHSTRLRN
jgi:hypothetical protein